MASWLWTVTPWGQPAAAPKAWTTFQVAHTAHSLDDEVGLFSIVKWASFRLSRFR
jgi:predicted peroxiredoxin